MSLCQTALNVPIWSVDSRENNWNCCQLTTRSHILKLQFNAPNSISVEAPLQSPLGELTALSRLPLWIFGVLLLREARRGKEAKREREGTKSGREGKGGRPLPSPSQFAKPLGQASPSRRPGLWVTWPGLTIFWPRNDLAPLLRWCRHWIQALYAAAAYNLATNTGSLSFAQTKVSNFSLRPKVWFETYTVINRPMQNVK